MQFMQINKNSPALASAAVLGRLVKKKKKNSSYVCVQCAWGTQPKIKGKKCKDNNCNKKKKAMQEKQIEVNKCTKYSLDFKAVCSYVFEQGLTSVVLLVL